MSGVNQQQISQLSRQAGFARPLTANGSEHDAQLLEGDFILKRHHSGILVHASDNVEQQDTEVMFELPAGLSATLLLAGELTFEIDGEHHPLQVRQGHPPVGFALVCDSPRTLKRELRQGRHLRKVNVSVNKDWLYRHCEQDAHACECIDSLFARHQANCFTHWHLSTELVTLAEQIFRPSPYTPFMQNLHVESRALDILDVTLSRLLQDNQGEPLPRKVTKARDIIESQLDTLDSIEQVADQIGTSVSTLQRLFRQHFQLTPAAYIRQRRLEKARDLLKQQAISIGEAAYLAGYRHPSNFITAYKRAFGYTPGER